MTKKFFTVVVLVALFGALLASSVLSKASYDPSDRLKERIQRFSFPQVAKEPVGWDDPVDWDNAITSYPPARNSLGSARSVASPQESPGFTVIESMNDNQFLLGGNRDVDFWGTPSIHFTYGSAPSISVAGTFGYNVYDPTNGGDWPRGSQVGCDIQTPDAEGLYVNSAVTPAGMVVLGGIDDAGGSLDNHFFWQFIPHGCTWLAGSIIEPSQYNQFFFDQNNYLNQPRLEYQVWEGDTILHVLAIESDSVVLQLNTGGGQGQNIRGMSLNYFRYVGVSMGGTWEGPFFIDTINSSSVARAISNGSIAASRVSGKVAVAYTKNNEAAWEHNARYDVEVWFRRSADAGVSWADATNMTNYLRDCESDEMSNNAFINTHSLFDTDDGYHIVWTGDTWPADVYCDPSFFLGDFSASIFHWTDRIAGPNAGGTIVRAHNAEFGIDFNSQVCGLASPGTSYVGYESIGECNGKLYLVFNQWLDALGDWGPPQVDDCASGFTDRRFAANGEVCMVVSSTLDGILWDFSRNLTNTYTPGCDSAGFGGLCLNDMHPTMSRFGMDSASFGEELTFPTGPLVPEGGTWAEGHYFHVFYTEDHYPGPAWLDKANDDYNDQTMNPLKWMRVPCLDPVEAPQIWVSGDNVGYPEFTHHGETQVITMEVRNDGNVPLTVTEIVAVEEGGPAGWLDISAASMSVPAGVTNTATFDIFINVGGIVNSPGTIVSLPGEVYLLSDAGNNDSAYIIVNGLVADTVIGFEFDTISTGVISLVVTNTAEAGYNGLGNVNLDFADNGGDCELAAIVYLYGGGPLLMRRNAPDDYTLNFAMYQQQFSTDLSFKRISEGESSSHPTGANFDGYFTGTVANYDSSIFVERTYWAPTVGADSTDFIIMETRYFSSDGSAQNNLIIGEAIDWDILSQNTNPADNNCGVMPDHNTVYIQGTDTAGAVPCEPNTGRFGTGMLLGYYLNSERGEDDCASTCVPYGVWGDSLHEYWDSVTSSNEDLQAYGDVWDSLTAHSGLTAESGADDLALLSTWVQNFSIPAGDTFTVYSVVTSVRNGTVGDLEDNLDAAFEWYRTNLRPGCDQLCGCCVGLTGNVDGSIDENPDLGDLTALIDYLFISFTVPTCFAEANVDGDPSGSVDLGDLTALIDYLFISFTPPAPCQ